MRPPKDIWTNNYNDFILDLYDANPLVQKDNGTVKKAPEPEKNPKKVEATPEESDGTLTNLVGESLRLRNTAVLNLKLTKNIFKWEKERLAKIKPFPDSDPLDGKKVVIIEEDEDDGGFKFPRFKFPKLPKLPKFRKIPNPFKKPSSKTSPSTLPKTAPSPIPKKEKEKQPQLELPRIPSIPFFPLPYLLPRFGEVAENVKVVDPEVLSDGVDSNSRTASRSSGSRLRDREVGADVGGGGSTTTATVERPEGAGKGPGGKGPGGKGKGTSGTGDIDPAKLNPIYEYTDSAEQFDLELEKLTKQGYAQLSTEELIEELKKRERKRNFRNIARSSKNKLPPSLEEKIIQEILEDRQGLNANRILGDIDPLSDTGINQQLKAVADDFKALPGNNPVTQSKFPSSQIVPFYRGLQKGDLYSMLEPEVFDRNPLLLDQARMDALSDIYNMEQSGLSKIKTSGDVAKFNQPPDLKKLQKLLKSNPSFSFTDGLKLPKLNVTGRALLRGSLGALDTGLVVYDYAQRKSEGQTDLQAVAGAGSSYAGGVAAQVGTGALITKYGLASMVTPVPGARPVGLFLLLLGAGVAGGYFGGKVSDAVTGVDNPSVKEGLNTNGVPVPEMDLTEELFSPEAIQQFEEMMKNIPNGGFAPQTPLLVPIPSFGNLSEFPSPGGNYNTWGHPTQGN